MEILEKGLKIRQFGVDVQWWIFLRTCTANPRNYEWIASIKSLQMLENTTNFNAEFQISSGCVPGVPGYRRRDTYITIGSSTRADERNGHLAGPYYKGFLLYIYSPARWMRFSILHSRMSLYFIINESRNSIKKFIDTEIRTECIDSVHKTGYR